MPLFYKKVCSGAHWARGVVQLVRQGCAHLLALSRQVMSSAGPSLVQVKGSLPTGTSQADAGDCAHLNADGRVAEKGRCEKQGTDGFQDESADIDMPGDSAASFPGEVSSAAARSSLQPLLDTSDRVATASDVGTEAAHVTAPAAKRKPGRPRKTLKAQTRTTSDEPLPKPAGGPPAKSDEHAMALGPQPTPADINADATAAGLELGGKAHAAFPLVKRKVGRPRKRPLPTVQDPGPDTLHPVQNGPGAPAMQRALSQLDMEAPAARLPVDGQGVQKRAGAKGKDLLIKTKRPPKDTPQLEIRQSTPHRTGSSVQALTQDSQKQALNGLPRVLPQSLSLPDVPALPISDILVDSVCAAAQKLAYQQGLSAGLPDAQSWSPAIGNGQPCTSKRPRGPTRRNILPCAPDAVILAGIEKKSAVPADLGEPGRTTAAERENPGAPPIEVSDVKCKQWPFTCLGLTWQVTLSPFLAFSSDSTDMSWLCSPKCCKQCDIHSFMRPVDRQHLDTIRCNVSQPHTTFRTTAGRPGNGLNVQAHGM